MAEVLCVLPVALSIYACFLSIAWLMPPIKIAPRSDGQARRLSIILQPEKKEAKCGRRARRTRTSCQIRPLQLSSAQLTLVPGRSAPVPGIGCNAGALPNHTCVYMNLGNAPKGTLRTTSWRKPPTNGQA
jgi:hypothetical protein